MAMNNRLMRPRATTAAAPQSGTPASLLLRFDGNFNDSSPNALAVTANGDAAINTTTKKYGSGAAYLDGNYSWVEVPNSEPLNLTGEVPYTIELWLYIQSHTENYTTILTKRVGVNWQYLLGFSEPATTELFFSATAQGNDGYSQCRSYAPLTVGEWHHVAAVVSGGGAKLFVDGVLVDTQPWATQPENNATIFIGQQSAEGEWFNGYVDEVRIVKGLAVFTTNYTPPAAPLAVNATPYVPQPPAAPTGVGATSGNGQLSIAWTASSSDSAITGYAVEYTPAGGSATTVSTGSSEAVYTLTGLANGTAYTVRVAAVSAVGTGPYSSASAPATPAAPSFTATAVMLTSGTSYTVPAGATSMKAWAVGSGTSGAGGTAFKTWSVSGGQSVAYAVGAKSTTNFGNDSSVTFGGATVTGRGAGKAANGTNKNAFGTGGGEFTGGDGGVAGGIDQYLGGGDTRFGAVGNNNAAATAATISTKPRFAAADVSGLFAALQLAGVNTTLSAGNPQAFGSGGFTGKYDNNSDAVAPGRGGGGSYGTAASGSPFVDTRVGGAVVLYFS